MKKLLISCMVVVFFFTVAVPVFAAPDQHFTNTEQQSMPIWLTEAGAKPVVDAELNMVQGEFALLSTLYYLAVVYGVPYAINYAAYVGTPEHLTMIALRYKLTEWVKSHWGK